MGKPLRLATEEIRARFKRANYTNDEGTFVIGSTDQGITVKGNTNPDEPLLPGCDYRFFGNWEDHPEYGNQFSFKLYVMCQPHTRKGVIAYLKNILEEKCGIGEVTINRLCDLYGPDNAIPMLLSRPDQVARDIPRLKLENIRLAAEQIQSGSGYQETRIELYGLFAGRGFPSALVDECVRKYKGLAPRKVKRDPFCLLVDKFKGVGFLTVDGLYQDLGLPNDKLKRQVYCLWYIIQKDMQGHTWFTEEMLRTEFEKLVSGNVQFERAVRLGLRAKIFSEQLGRDEKTGQRFRWITVEKYAEHESYVGRRIHVLAGFGLA